MIFRRKILKIDYNFGLLSFTVLPDPELDFLNFGLPEFRRENDADDIERSSDQLRK